MKTQVLNIQTTLNAEKATQAVTNAEKAAEKMRRIDEYMQAFSLGQMAGKLAELVEVRKDSDNKKKLAYWYDKNIREYKSPLFIFNQLSKGGDKNPYNVPKEKLKEFKISTKLFNGVNLLAGLPLHMIVKQVILQGRYSPNMINTAYKAAIKAEVFKTAQGINDFFGKSQKINTLVIAYAVEQSIDLPTFMVELVKQYPSSDAQTDNFKKAVATMLVSAEIAAEKDDAKKAAEAEILKAENKAAAKT